MLFYDIYFCMFYNKIIMNKITVEQSRQVIQYYDKILELTGEKIRMTDVMETFNSQLDELAKKERGIDEERIVDIKAGIVTSVMQTVAAFLCSTIAYSAKSMLKLSTDKEACKKAMDEYMEKNGGKVNGSK